MQATALRLNGLSQEQVPWNIPVFSDQGSKKEPAKEAEIERWKEARAKGFPMSGGKSIIRERLAIWVPCCWTRPVRCSLGWTIGFSSVAVTLQKDIEAHFQP